MKTETLGSNIELHLLETGKFKDVLISFRFIHELKEPDNGIRTLLALMLADRCEKYPTKQEVSRCLDGLYGASASCRTTTCGRAQVLEFRIRALNEKYVGGELLKRQIALASQFLLHPLKENGLLSSAVYNEAMINLKAMIQRRHDNPSSYAAARCAQLLAEGQPLGIGMLPDMEQAQKITLQQVSEAYEDMILHDRLDIFVEGLADQDQVIRCVREHFPLSDRQGMVDCCYALQRQDKVSGWESREMDQTALVMMYPTGVTLRDEDYWALRTGNCIFGQLPTSMLFQQVREKRSLCYSIYSSVLSYDGVLSVSTGIDRAQLQQVQTLIEQQRQRMADGDFDEEMLEMGKTMLIQSLQASQDDPHSVINREYQNVLLGRHQTLDQMIAAIRQVSRQKIMALFAQMSLKAVFALCQKEGDHEENSSYPF